MSKPKDGAYLMYVKDGVMYPVALSESEHTVLQIFAKTFEPLKLATGFGQQAMDYSEAKNAVRKDVN
jgi:hypothetical protein